MAASLTGYLKLQAGLADQRTAVTGAAKEGGTRSIQGDYAWTVANGTSSGMADKVWGDTRTVTTGATDSLDLAGSLTDAFGETITFVKVKAILVYAAAANTTTLTITRPTAAGVVLFGAADGTVAALSAGGFFAWVDPAAGFTVGSTSSDALDIVNSSGASASYEIIVVGTSA